MPNNIDMGGFMAVGGPLFPLAAPGFVTQLNNQALQRSVSLGITYPFTGFLTANTPDSTFSGGNARGAQAVDWQTNRAQASQIASGICSVLAGGVNNISGGSRSTVGGGDGNNASAAYSTIAGGVGNAAQGQSSGVLSGEGNVASGTNAWIGGGSYATTRGLTGAYAQASVRRSASGDNQRIGQIVGVTTTGATTITLTATRAAVVSTNVMVLPNNSSLSGIVVGTARDSSGNCATWIRAFRVTRGANAASTAVAWDVDLVTPSIDAALSTATFVTAADTTQGAAVWQFTGVAATTIDALAEPLSLQIVR